MSEVDEVCVKTIRFLAVDAVEKAKSGHPGLPLGAAPMAYALWDRILRYNPKNSTWFNRDRFILSAGHGSALLYSLLHLYGYDLSMDELKRFRQYASKTPGHPEYGLTEGVEATTGPLGQGFGMGVGMAVAERFLGECLNLPAYPLIDHYTYAIVSDGDLMEGVASEAASIAGTLKLGKLIYLYDDNHISIEGETDIAFTENVVERFEAYGWHVQKVADGNNLDVIEKAVLEAKKVNDKPSLILVRTHIGYGSPKQDNASAHGEPLGEEAVRTTKETMGWPIDKKFYVPEAAMEHFKETSRKGRYHEDKWNVMLKAYKTENHDLYLEFERIMNGALPDDWDSGIESFSPDDDPIATRSASGKVMNTLSKRLPHTLVGGSADLAPSTKTLLLGYGDFGFGKYCSHNLHFGVREHGMGTIVNGLALHGGIIPYGATFLIFSDYMRPAIRLAALMNIHSIFVFTHDSIGLGEDGPTHQPVEQLMSLRTIPNLTVLRPADANETLFAWKMAIRSNGPVAMLLTRQKLPILDSEKYHIEEGVARGAYVLSEAFSKPDITIMASGSEVHLAVAAKVELEKKGLKARVVSMPSWEIFEKQSSEYKSKVLLDGVPRIAIEAGVTLGWHKYTGEKGDIIGVDRFGASAPGKVVYEKLGLNLENVIKRALLLIDVEKK